MAGLESLLKRIDAEFSGLDSRIKQAQAAHVHEHQARHQRLETFETLLTELTNVWRPRLEALVERFGDKVEVTPKISSSSREASLKFKSNLAQIRLCFSASTDQEVRNLVLDYNLEILPILMKFESHQRAEWPIDRIDRDAIAGWVDDRIVDFVKTYLSLHENEYYLKDHMVEDPVAHIRFPKFAAAATCEQGGATYYFVGIETCQEFKAKHGVAAK